MGAHDIVGCEFYTHAIAFRSEEAHTINEQRTILIIIQRLLKICQIPILVRSSHGAHALYFAELGVFDGKFDGEEGGYVFGLRNEKRKLIRMKSTKNQNGTYEVEHDFAEEHVF